MSVFEQTAVELRRAAGEARERWGTPAWLALAALAIAAVIPFLSLPGVRIDALADTAYLALAATALGLKGLVAALAVRFGPPLWAFAAGLALGVIESAIANVHFGGWQLGPSYREVLPLAFVLLLISLRPSPEALEERE